LFSPDGVAPIQIVSVSASVICPCTTKSGRRFLLALAQPDSPGKGAVKWLCVFQPVSMSLQNFVLEQQLLFS